MEKTNKPTLYLHIGMHKTGTTYLQNILRENQEYLLENEGLFFPDYAGVQNGQLTTRSGANSGHGAFTHRREQKSIHQRLIEDCERLKPKSVLISSENFTIWRRRVTAKQYLARFQYFEKIVVILVLRRQDRWIESYYKQLLDGFIDFEIRSIEQFCNDLDEQLFDYKARFQPWREIVGSKNFRVGSYDEIVANLGLMNWLCAELGLTPETQTFLSNQNAAKYPSTSGLNSFALRILNSLVITNKETRTKIVRELYDAGEDNNFDLLPKKTAEKLRMRYQASNEWIAKNWMQSDASEFSEWKTLHYTDTPVPNAQDANLVVKLNVLADSIERHCGPSARALAFRNLDKIITTNGSDKNISQRLMGVNDDLRRARKILQARLSNSSKRYLVADITRKFKKVMVSVWRRLNG
ncbi:hypothetical protein BFP76_11900 [Amylibacter kogurei]|uniref:Sulfotransferase domain-containing protein n=1 Tax=Paramylibacter kogurei TaxID=1889778 RepID=A0A2G5KAP1_9RHOB|nr:hypothetical protein [Amylibacter kogurei]PIB26591.1 hypothetical protein BFP76_11900 [Amylibacter kogurei]